MRYVGYVLKTKESKEKEIFVCKQGSYKNRIVIENGKIFLKTKNANVDLGGVSIGYSYSPSYSKNNVAEIIIEEVSSFEDLYSGVVKAIWDLGEYLLLFFPDALIVVNVPTSTAKVFYIDNELGGIGTSYCGIPFISNDNKICLVNDNFGSYTKLTYDISMLDSYFANNTPPGIQGTYTLQGSYTADISNTKVIQYSEDLKEVLVYKADGDGILLKINENGLVVVRRDIGILYGEKIKIADYSKGKIDIKYPKRIKITLVNKRKGEKSGIEDYKIAHGIIAGISDILTSKCVKVGNKAICQIYAPTSTEYRVYDNVIDIYGGGNGVVILTKDSVISVGYDFTSDTRVAEAILPIDPNNIHDISVNGSMLIVQTKDGNVYLLGKTPPTTDRIISVPNVSNNNLYSSPVLVGNFPLARKLLLQTFSHYYGDDFYSMVLIGEDGNIYYDNDVINTNGDVSVNGESIYVIEGGAIKRYYRDFGGNLTSRTEGISLVGKYKIFDQLNHTSVRESTVIVDEEKAVLLGYFMKTYTLDLGVDNMDIIPCGYKTFVINKNDWNIYEVAYASSSFPLGGNIVGNLGNDEPLRLVGISNVRQKWVLTKNGNIMSFWISGDTYQGVYERNVIRLIDGELVSGKWALNSDEELIEGVILGFANMV